MSDTNLPYCVSFDTQDMPGRVKAVRVDLSVHMVRPNDNVRVDLCDHPLYPKMEQYVLTNPSKGRGP